MDGEITQLQLACEGYGFNTIGFDCPNELSDVSDCNGNWFRALKKPGLVDAKGTYTIAASESQSNPLLPVFTYSITHGTDTVTARDLNSSAGFVANLYRSPLTLGDILNESGAEVTDALHLTSTNLEVAVIGFC